MEIRAKKGKRTLWSEERGKQRNYGDMGRKRWEKGNN